MIGRKRLATALASALLTCATSAFAAADLTSVNIVDAPRPQEQWGFAPVNSKIQPGTWVTWSNSGQDAHTVTAVDGTFDSENIDPSEGFSWYFAEPGTFAYLCKWHPWMMGKIVVGDGVAPIPEDMPTDAGSSGDQPLDVDSLSLP